jgi:hypothetical protein
MPKADRVHSTPPPSTSVRNSRRLAAQERRRQKALQRLAKLREEAAAEIERLLTFLDACDPYVMNELEDDGDEGDASYPEGGARMVAPMEDDEDSADGEPSLGWTADGCLTNATEKTCDLEQGEAARPPQFRTVIQGAAEVDVEISHRRVVVGIPAVQQKALANRLDESSDVVLR